MIQHFGHKTKHKIVVTVENITLALQGNSVCLEILVRNSLNQETYLYSTTDVVSGAQHLMLLFKITDINQLRGRKIVAYKTLSHGSVTICGFNEYKRIIQ
jgi:hypothetical protein